MEVVGRVRQAWETAGKARTICDAGHGEGQIARLREMGVPVEEFAFSRTSKVNLLSKLRMALEAGEVGLSKPEGCDERAWATLREELLIFQEIPTSDGIKLGAPSGAHDDCVIALALAWEAQSRGRGMGVSWY